MNQPATQTFSFKEIDLEGLQTLDAIAEAPRFNRWMYETIRPFCFGNILEVGSGTGNISDFFLKNGASLTVSDVRENYCSILREKFDGNQNLKGILLLDLVAPDFEEKFAHAFGTFDTVFALNVVEHIEDDALAIQNCKKLLRKNGHLVILVPAFQRLYNRFDEGLEHYRRYNKRKLSHLIRDNGFDLTHRQYFNFPGIFGWIFSGSILKKDVIPESQMRLFDKLVPIFRVVDNVIFKMAGLSVIAVGRKA